MHPNLFPQSEVYEIANEFKYLELFGFLQNIRIY